MSTNTPLTKCSVCGQSFASTVKLCPNDGSVLEHDTSETHIGEVLDGKYRLDSFLSRGGMGAVYRATHVMLNRTVAVKLINAEYVTSVEASRRFQREARAATALNHPNIVSVFDLGQTPKGTLYIAMELVDGASLKSEIASNGPLTPARTISILKQVANALAVAHRNNIVHRDLKPQNIMLTRTDTGEERVKLVDFGIAKTFDTDLTQLTVSGAALGTPHYMSPEQAAGDAVDGRSDLYSLGVVLYEMLSGDVPFNDKSVTAIIIKHMKDPPEPPSVRNPGVKIPPALEAATLRCLEKDPARRFQNMEEFSAALDEAAASIPAGTAPALKTPPASEQPTLRNIERPGVAAVAASASVPADTRQTAVRGDTRPTNVRAVSTPPVVPPAAAHPKVAAAPVGGKIVAKKSSNAAALGILVAAILLVFLGTAIFLSQRRSSAPEAQTAAIPSGDPATAVPESQQAAQGNTGTPASREPISTPVPPSSASPAGAPGATIGAASEKAGTSPSRPGSSSAGAAEDVRKESGREGAAPAASAPISTTAVAARADTGAGSTTPSASSRTEPGARQAQPAQFPENPAIYFHCSGAPEICGTLRSEVEQALDGAGLTSVRAAARADIDIAATVEGLQQTVNRQFDTTFAVRTYSIDLSADTTRTSEAVPMPPPSNVSFDPQFGTARVTERARLVAADIVERVKAFVKKKRGG